MPHPSQDAATLTIDQQRTRLQLLLAAEKAKLMALLAATGNDSIVGQSTILASEVASEDASEVAIDTKTLGATVEAENLALYGDLIETQQRLIADLEAQIEQLTHQLEGPDLRSRLRKTEASLKTTRAELSHLQTQLDAVDINLTQVTAELDALRQQNQHLTTLNDKYVQQIASLSIHERQNVEDHAHTVLAISRQLAAAGLDIPAKASAASPAPILEGESVEAWVTDSGLDQTLFVNNFYLNDHLYSVTLVVSVTTPNTDTHPIEVMLSELNRVDEQGRIVEKPHNHQIHQFKGFSTAEAVVSAQYFIHLCQQLTAKQQQLETTSTTSGV